MDRTEIETEALDAESRKVAELLGTLKRVEAPSNFEFGVRARIANGSPVRRSGLLPVLKFAAPLALILILLTIVGVYNYSPTTTPLVSSEPPPAADISTNPGPASNAEAVTEPQEPVIAQVPPRASEPEVIQPNLPSNSTPLGRRVPRRRDTNPPSGGTLPNQGLTEPEVINPPGIHPNIGRTSNSNSDAANIPVREVLEMLGLSLEAGSGSWKVKSTADGSVGRKSGIQAGDVIEAIDGQALTPNTSFKGKYEGKTIRVRRDGKSMDVKLTN